MRTLLVIRHAKSTWAKEGQRDFDRPLNNRGNQDAAEMAKRLVEKSIHLDALFSSPARRALTTCMYFAKALNIIDKNILPISQLYNADASTFFNVISETNDSFNAIAIFSHNPGITDFVNDLTTTKIDIMPTCGIFAVQFESNHWKDFSTVEKGFLFFDFPRSIK